MKPASDAAARSDPVTDINLLLTTGCNLSCVYCYQGARRERRAAWPALRRALAWALAQGGERLTIAMSGGEPLLAADHVRRVLDYATAHAPPGLAVGFTLLTNGLLLDDGLYRHLAAHGVEIRLSVDGAPAAQDQRGRGTFAVLDALCDRLRTAAPEHFRSRVVAVMTVTPPNLIHLAEGVAHLLGKGFGRISIGPVYTPGPGWREPDLALMRTQFERVRVLSLAERERTGAVPVSLLDHYDLPAAAPDREGATCAASARRKFAVDVDGQAYACTMFADSVRIGGETSAPFSAATLLGVPGTAEFDARSAAHASRMAAIPLFRHHPERRGLFGRCAACRHAAACLVCPGCLVHDPRADGHLRVPGFVCAFNAVANETRSRFPARPLPLEAELHPAVMARRKAEFKAEIARILGSPGA